MDEIRQNKPKKICIITTVSITIKSFALETAKHLYNECGYDVTFICDNDDAFAESLPEYLHYIPVPMSRGIDFSGFVSVFKLYRIFREQKFDLVQYSTPNASCYASIAAFFARVPKRMYAQWGIRYAGLSGMSRRIFKFLEKMVCTLSTDIRAVSHLNKAFAVSEKLYKADKAIVVGNGGTIGVDMNVFDINTKNKWKNEIRSKYGFSDEDFVYGFSGRVSADKGCGELLAAFKKVSERNINAKLLVVGAFEEDGRIDTDVLSWAKESENVVFAGRIDKSEMRMYYSAMDILVHPTYREGFGMVIQEAGALAIPVITTKIPGASEVMEDGVSCYLVEPRSKEKLEKMMLQCYSDKADVENKGRAAYDRTARLYDRSIMLENLKNDYTELLENGEER